MTQLELLDDPFAEVLANVNRNTECRVALLQIAGKAAMQEVLHRAHRRIGQMQRRFREKCERRARA